MEPRVSQEDYAKYFLGFSAHSIVKDGVSYPTVEHAYHCMRYTDQNVVEEIRTAASPLLAWRISQKYKDKQLADFPERKREVMKELYRLKLEQHEDVKEALLKSKGLQIVKHITSGPPADGFWDDGTDGLGRNESGKIWMELREEI